MRFKIIITLVLFVCLSGAYYYFDVSGGAGKKKENKTPPVFAFNPEDVAAVTLKRPGQPVIVLDRQDKTWTITSPVKARADEETVEKLISSATELKVVKDLGAVENLAEFGLAEPEEALFVTSGGNMFTLKIGDKAQTGKEYYLMASGRDTVFLASARPVEAVTKGLGDLRNKKLFDFDALDVKSLELKLNKLGLKFERLSKSKDGKEVKPEDAPWKMTIPHATQADGGAILKLLSILTTLKGIGFVSGPEGESVEYGLKNPEITVKMGTDKGTFGFAMGHYSPDGGRYIKRLDTGEILTVDDRIEKDLPQSAEAFMDLRIHNLTRENITRVKIEMPEGKTVITRKPGKVAQGKQTGPEWIVTEPAGLVMEEMSVMAFLYDLENAKYLRIAGPASKGLSKPALTITISAAGGDKALTLAKAPANKGDSYFASFTGRDDVVEVSGETFKSLFKNPGEFEDRRFFKILSDQIGRVVVNRKGQVFDVSKKDEDFTMAAPENKKVSAEAWRALVWALSGFRFSQRAPEGAAGGLDKPVLTVSVYNKSGGLVDEVAVGARAGKPGYFYARSVRTKELFLVGERFVTEDMVASLESLLSS
ncbi:MAG: DUF4340 domain-containing protein [Nitrospinae bacterium]|nr:DUF4340 domain-containing protein [Nitrospinota bacterium]